MNGAAVQKMAWRVEEYMVREESCGSLGIVRNLHLFYEESPTKRP